MPGNRSTSRWPAWNPAGPGVVFISEHVRHDRRSRDRPGLARQPGTKTMRVGPKIVSVAIAALAAGMAGAALSASGRRPPVSFSVSPATPVPPPSATAPRISVSTAGQAISWHGLPRPEAFATSAGLLIAWQTTPLGGPVAGVLARVDPTTGTIVAQTTLPGAVTSVVPFFGALWAVGLPVDQPAGGSRAVAWELDRRTMAVERTVRLSGLVRSAPGTAAAVAAGGQLWVTHGSTLFRIAPAGRTVVGRFRLTRNYANTSLAVDPTSGRLLVAAALGTALVLQARDPVSGAVHRTTTLPVSALTVGLATPVDGQLWVSASSGMLGSVRAFSATTLEPLGRPCAGGSTGDATCIAGTNGIRAAAANGTVVVTQAGGGPARNVCIDPASDTRLAALPLPAALDQAMLAIDGDELIVAGHEATGNRSQTVSEVRLPRACTLG